MERGMYTSVGPAERFAANTQMICLYDKFSYTERFILRKYRIINHSIINRWKQNFIRTYVGRCGDNWVTEDAVTGFPETQTNTTLHDDDCSSQHGRRE
jgi:hypothetical protein